MSNKISKAIFEEQKKTKPNIEDVIGNFLEGDALNNAMDFIAFLRESKMNPRWVSINAWRVTGKKGKSICNIRLGGGAEYHHYKMYKYEVGEWVIGDLEGLDRKYLDEFISRDEMEKFIWENIKPCTRCCSCGPRHRKYAGKEFAECCGLVIKNPDAKGVELAKKLVEANKQYIYDNA